MILIHNGIRLDTNFEQSILTKRKFGLDAICIFKKGSYKESQKGKQVIHHWHNLTHIHSGYEHMPNCRDRIAFESDIHGAGGWRLIGEIDTVIIHSSTQRFNTNCEVVLIDYNKPVVHSFVKFFEGSVPDYKGRYIDEILDYSPKQFEEEHDYIQVIFPLKEASRYNPDAELITDEDVEKIKNSPMALATASRALYTMMFHYIEQSEWATPYNHNLLRITRILKFTNMMFGESNARSVLSCIMSRCKQLNFRPNDNTLEFWNLAVQGKSPEIENDHSVFANFGVRLSTRNTKRWC